MATFHIKATDTSSIFVAGQTAFEESGPGTLIVDPNAYLISASGGNGAVVDGNWTITINGAVEALDPNIDFSGLELHADTSTDHSTVTVGKQGDIAGSATGLFTEDALHLINAGSIAGTFEGLFLEAGSNNNAITNSGVIHGVTEIGLLDEGSGLLTINNTGKIIGLTSAILATSQVHLTNTGSLQGGVGFVGETDDLFNDFRKVGAVIKNGTVTGTIDLGDGNDHFNGGAHAETVTDGGAADHYSLGGGNDTYLAVGNSGADGNDKIDGGSGIDTYDASAAVDIVVVNLDKVIHANIAAGTAQGNDVSGGFVQTDKLTNFENASGGAGQDTIFGNAGANVLNGNAGADLLVGVAGNDHLFGGDGADTLIGSKGADILTGGNGADRFQFVALGDSTVAKAGHDTITDFSAADSDRIDLSAIDAIKGGTDDPFSFIGVAHFHHVAGELRESFSGGNTLVSGDVNGDGKADFAITLQGHILLTGGDLIL